MALGEDEVRSRFGSHETTHETRVDHVRVRDRFTNLGLILDEMLPDGRDKSLVFTHLEDAAMRAHRSLSHQNPLIKE